MRNYKAELEDTVKLLRYYMEHKRTQSFAAVFPLYVKQKKRCEINGINTEIYVDINKYAADEKIERFGFVY